MTEKAPCGACDACEHCPFPDCTWDGVTRAEWDAAKAEDASARHFGESKLAAQKRAYTKPIARRLPPSSGRTAKSTKSRSWKRNGNAAQERKR